MKTEIEQQAREWLEQFPTVYQPSSDCGSFRSMAVTGFKITPKDVAKLIADAFRSGYERGVREAAEKALPTNLDMAEHEDELCATYYERGRNDASEAILSLINKKD